MYEFLHKPSVEQTAPAPPLMQQIQNDSVCSVRDAASSVYSTPNKRRIVSPVPEGKPMATPEAHLRIAVSLGVPTADLVATTLNNAIASVRCGEVINVPAGRVLHTNRTASATVANNVGDLTPKKVVHRAQHAKTLFF